MFRPPENIARSRWKLTPGTWSRRLDLGWRGGGLGVALTGWLWLDALVGIGVALNILKDWSTR